MALRQARKARRAAQSEELVALAAAFKKMTVSERAAQARRRDLTDHEQLALAAFADDPEVAAALLDNPELSSPAGGLADAMRWRSKPWWRRWFGFP